jgi:hypothetical protein
MDDHFADAEAILEKLTSYDLDVATFSSDSFGDAFMALEGAQEDAYETLLALEGSLEDYAAEMEEEDAEALRKADLLTSTSLFMDLEKAAVTVVEEKAEDAEIESMKRSLFDDFDAAFAGLSKEEKRSRMAKVLSMVPVFFNSREEVRAYFLYALENCRDDSELTAVSHLIHDMILDQ